MIFATQFTVEYDTEFTIPPQVFISRVNEFTCEMKTLLEEVGEGHTLSLHWEREERTEPREDNDDDEDVYVYNEDEDSGYQGGHAGGGNDAPVVRGTNHCQYCLCSPCVIVCPPDFLRGYCGPHPANSDKRYRLYRKFFVCLRMLGVWSDREYFRYKEGRIAHGDQRDTMPLCIINEVRRRYPTHDGDYTHDYWDSYPMI